MKLNAMLLISVGLALNTGCGPLRKTQVSLVKNYFNTIADHPANIQQLNDRLAELSLESQNLQSSLYPSDSQRITSLMHAIHDYENSLALPDSIAIELERFQAYISGYYILLPDGFNVYNAFKSTSESVVGIFGFQSIVSSVLPEKSENVSASKKRRMLTHLKTQSIQVRESLSKIKQYVDEQMLPVIDKTNEIISKDVQQLFMSGDTPISPLDHYFKYNNYFIDYFQNIIRLRKLTVRVSASIDQVLLTEQEILGLTSTPQKIRQDSDQLHRLANDMQKIKVLMSQWDL